MLLLRSLVCRRLDHRWVRVREPVEYEAICGRCGDVKAFCPRCGHGFALPGDFPKEWANCPNCGLNGGDWLARSPSEPQEAKD